MWSAARDKRRMLRDRVLTALLLAPPFLLSIIYLPSRLFALIAGVFVLLAAWEWSGLLGIEQLAVRSSYVICAFLLAVPLYLQPGVVTVLAVAVIWWLFALYRLTLGFHRPWSLLSRVLGGLIVLPTGWYAVYSLHWGPYGWQFLLVFFLLIWAADVGAYAFGRAFGHRRLAPRISPGKTVEGVIGGLVVVGAVAGITGALVSREQDWTWPGWMFLCVMTALASVLGDLFESQLKRTAGVKDSGTLLPGHGGVLDRIDGITASAPVFAVGLRVFDAV